MPPFRPVLVIVLALFLVPTLGAQKQRREMDSAGRLAQYLRSRPALGEMAPDFALLDLQGHPVRLKDWRGRRPMVIEFGSYT